MVDHETACPDRAVSLNSCRCAKRLACAPPPKAKFAAAFVKFATSEIPRSNMKKSYFMCLLAIASIVANAFAAEPKSTEPAKSAAYFTEMRMQFAKRPDYDGGSWLVDPEREELLKHYDDADPTEFITNSEKWLKKCPVDAKVHLMRSDVLLKAGDFTGHFYHRLVYYGLVTSIVTSGDGKTPKTAYKVVSVSEEYTVLNHIGANLKKQSLVETWDQMDVELRGKDETIYFDASVVLEGERKSMGKSLKK